MRTTKGDLEVATGQLNKMLGVEYDSPGSFFVQAEAGGYKLLRRSERGWDDVLNCGVVKIGYLYDQMCSMLRGIDLAEEYTRQRNLRSFTVTETVKYVVPAVDETEAEDLLLQSPNAFADFDGSVVDRVIVESDDDE